MSDFRDMLVRWLDQRLTHILAAPPMWGCPEAVELQVLQLIQARAVAQGMFPAPEASDRVFDVYLSYLRQQFPNQPQRPLFELVGQDDETYSRLAAGLRGFVEAIIPTMSEPKPRRRPPSLASSEPHNWLNAA